ncbi:MAG: hypothetical protein ACREIT_06320, partial [Tepidisphaeraceae bacterium]
MSDEEVLCPTCGGVLYAPGGDLAGDRWCTCTKTKTHAGAGNSSAGGSGTKTKLKSSDSTVSPSSSTATAAPKTCIQCGTDVNGKKRMKDSKGQYWCYECGRADQKKKEKESDPGGVVCPDCLQNFPPVQLIKYDGKYLCQACMSVRARKKKVKEVGGVFSKYLKVKGGARSDMINRQKK